MVFEKSKKDPAVITENVIDKPPVPALKPCRMICESIKCKFRSHCWGEVKPAAKELEKLASKSVKLTGNEKLIVAL